MIQKRLCLTVVLLALLATSSPVHGQSEGRSVWKAIGISLLVPGSGELYLGNTKSAVPFIAAEVASWLAYFGFRVHGDALTTEYKLFAHSYISADPNNPNEDYWYVMEMYYSRDVYIERLLREARQIYPDDPAAQQDYVQSHAISADWAWPSKSVWFAYQDRRKAARTAYERARIMLGVMILNRLASAAEIFFSRHNNNSGVSLDMRVLPNGKFMVGFVKLF